MAVIRNTASALRKGKVGNETYYVSLNKQIVRVAQNDSNYGESASRTQRQQNNRVKWANLVNFYKLSKAWMRKAFETKKSNQTDYNRFMQLNLAASRIYLTKEAAMAGAVVADAFIISQGSLRSINITSHGSHWDTDILLGSLFIGESTTVGQFSSAVLAANNWARPNMQISFISYQQDTDPYGFPVALCTAYEVTLDENDNTLLRSHLPAFCSQSDSNGRLGTSEDISVGAFAYVLSQTIGGKTIVSTQNLITNNESFILQYSSTAALMAATASYGVQLDAFLDSGSEAIPATPQPIYITSMVITTSGNTFLPGQTGPTRTEANGPIKLNLSTPLAEGIKIAGMKMHQYDGSQAWTLSNVTIAEDRMSVTGTPSEREGEQRQTRFELITTDGTYNLILEGGTNVHE